MSLAWRMVSRLNNRRKPKCWRAWASQAPTQAELREAWLVADAGWLAG